MANRRKQAEDYEEILRSQINQLDAENRAKFFKEINKEIKDPDTYAALNFLCLGGFHHFYLKKWYRGAINLVGFLLSLIFMFSGFQPLVIIGIIAVLVIAGTEAYAMFFSQTIVMEYNNKVTEQLLSKFRKNHNESI